MCSKRTEWEQKGYDAWVELWIQYECSPSATQCPARHMKEGPARSEFIHGWSDARREHEGKLSYL